MESLSGWFESLLSAGQGAPPVVTVVGSGGKTALIELLARQLTQGGRKTLAGPTTKMRPLPPIPGVTMTGRLNRESGKLESLPLPELERAIRDYDLVLLEGDGSRGLPLKGWAPHEPVIPRFTLFTVGILPVWPLGKILSEELVHRLPLFCALTGAKPGEALRADHLAALVNGRAGQRSLFSEAQGEKILFISQIEDDAAHLKARELAALLAPGLAAVIAGSARLDRLVLL